MGAFFFRIYEFLLTFSNPSPVIHRPRVPERYTIKFVPTASTPASSVSPVMSSGAVFVPVELPPRYAIKFVPAVNASVSADVSDASPVHFAVSSSVVPAIDVTSSSSISNPVTAASDILSSSYSVVSSANFVIPPAPVILSSTCIDNVL